MVLAGELDEAIDRGETDLEGRLAALGRLLRDLLTASAPWLDMPPAGPIAPTQARPLEASHLGALRAHLCHRNLQARRHFEALRPALANALGEATTEALGRAIHGLRYAEALATLDEAAPDASNRNTTGEMLP